MKFNLDIDTSNIVAKVTEVCNDGYVLRDIHRLLAEMCEDYVPFDTGKLNRATYYDKNGVHYGVHIPYAHYVYEGLVYGPNIQYVDKKTGELKWTSPVYPKYPTGDEMNYQTDVHPLATSHWDKVMLQDKGEEFAKKAEEIVKRRLKKLNG